MSDIGVTLRIDKVGDREALQSLNLLDAKGQQIVESIAGRTGKALGDVASAYTRAGTAGQKYFQDLAKGYDRLAAQEVQQQKEIDRTTAARVREGEQGARAMDALEMRQAHSIATATRGLEMLGRTGQLTGRSLDAVVGQVSAMAFAFGPTGQIVAAIGITTAAVVELFMRTSREAKKLAEETAKEFEKIAHMGVEGQAKEAQTLFGGDRFAADPDKRLSLAAIREQRAKLIASLPKNDADLTLENSYLGFGIGKLIGAEYTKTKEAIDRLGNELDRRENMLKRITNPVTGSMGYAGAQAAESDHWNWLDEDRKKGESAADRAGKAAEKAYAAYLKSMKKMNDDAVTDLVDKLSDTDQKWLSPRERLERAANRQTKEQSAALSKADEKAEAKDLKVDLGGVRGDVDAATKFLDKNDFFKNQKKAFDAEVKSLARHMEEALGSALSQGIAAGFESAFSGKGIGEAFKSLISATLSGLGNFLEQLGGAAIITGTWLEAFATSVKKLDGGAAIAAGIGLVAAGAAMKAVAGSFGGGSSGSGYGGGGSFGSTGLASIIDRGVINPSSYSNTDARTIKPRSADTFVFFGVNDPQAVRWFDEMDRKRNQRGSLAGA